jgi:hypothetical protein
MTKPNSKKIPSQPPQGPWLLPLAGLERARTDEGLSRALAATVRGDGPAATWPAWERCRMALFMLASSACNRGVPRTMTEARAAADEIERLIDQHYVRLALLLGEIIGKQAFDKLLAELEAEEQAVRP